MTEQPINKNDIIKEGALPEIIKGFEEWYSALSKIDTKIKEIAGKTPKIEPPKNKHILHFDIGDSVYLKTDPEQCERLVTGVNIRQNGISYALSHLTNESYHYDFEITKERDIIKVTSS